MRVEVKVTNKNKKWGEYCCVHKDKDCKWRLYAGVNNNHEIEVKTISGRLTCTGLGFKGSMRTHKPGYAMLYRNICLSPNLQL